jgi:hypothetical protein
MSSSFALAGVIVVAAMGTAIAQGASNRVDLHEIVANRTVTLHTPAGALPISYSGNGTMIGRAKDLEFYTGSAFDRGTWWVAADRICHRWRSWLGGKDHCVSLRLEGDKVHWRSTDGYSGTATLGAKSRVYEAGMSY